MNEPCLLALGFEPWTTALGWQTHMYVYRHLARDGARLYISLPQPAARREITAEEKQWLLNRVEHFFSLHGGMAQPHAERLAVLSA